MLALVRGVQDGSAFFVQTSHYCIISCHADEIPSHLSDAIVNSALRNVLIAFTCSFQDGLL